jgi:diaminopimelate epimerase
VERAGRQVAFAKGHGTQNDFVLLDDPDGLLLLTPERVAELCDRHRGLGGDGLIRVIRTSAAVATGMVVGAGPPPAGSVDAATPGGETPAGASADWFMDYRNADGSLAEMCGNGIRVFAAHLARRGWITVPDGGRVAVLTRHGVLTVRREGELWAADLGAWRLPDGEAPPVTVTTPGRSPLPGTPVEVGNPHLVVFLSDPAGLAALDLGTAPGLDPAPPAGANVEFVVRLPDRRLPGDADPTSAAPEGQVAMRVVERGVGETRSCGTGAVAAALATRAAAGPGAPDRWWVDVPGGRLRVTLDAGERLRGEHVELAGPAVLVADGFLTDQGS